MTDFLTRCLQKDKKQRIRAGDMLRHPVFKEVHEKYKYIFPTPDQARELMEKRSLEQHALLKKKSSKASIASNLENQLNKALFIQEVGRNLLMVDRMNCTSIFLIKECLYRLWGLYSTIDQRSNYPNCDEETWKELVTSTWY